MDLHVVEHGFEDLLRDDKTKADLAAGLHTLRKEIEKQDANLASSVQISLNNLVYLGFKAGCSFTMRRMKRGAQVVGDAKLDKYFDEGNT